METKERYSTPETEVIHITIEGVIAESPQLEKPEDGGDYDPWGDGGE